jgi:hypothetical protein
MADNALYTWDGRWWGFTSNGRIFSKSCEYKGWIDDDGRAWRSNGTFLGELVDETYVLRRTAMMATPARRAARARPAQRAPRAPRANRAPRAPRSGRVDALADL